MTCHVSGNPVCTCLPGYQPQPDTITGCSYVEPRTPPPDPCFPSPCGPNTQCNVNRLGNPVCQVGYIFIEIENIVVKIENIFVKIENIFVKTENIFTIIENI